MRECRIKEAYQKCKCIPFLYKEQEKYPYCGLDGLVCIAQHKGKSLSFGTVEKIGLQVFNLKLRGVSLDRFTVI